MRAKNPDDISGSVIGLYQTHAREFDALRGRKLMEAGWLRRFLALLPEKADILDIGCGSSEPIARHFIENGHSLTGLDSSGPLIALCKTRFPGHRWLVDDMRRLSLEKRFDGLIAWHSFFHLKQQDQRAMFPLFRSHAAEGAALMFTSGTGDGEAIGSFEGKPLYHASLDPSEYERLLSENGFRLVSHVAEDPTCGGATVWLAQRTG